MYIFSSQHSKQKREYKNQIFTIVDISVCVYNTLHNCAFNNYRLYLPEYFGEPSLKTARSRYNLSGTIVYDQQSVQKVFVSFNFKFAFLGKHTS